LEILELILHDHPLDGPAQIEDPLHSKITAQWHLSSRSTYVA